VTTDVPPSDDSVRSGRQGDLVDAEFDLTILGPIESFLGFAYRSPIDRLGLADDLGTLID